MPSAEKDVPCRLAEGKVWHPAHNWNPMVADPEDPQVLHIFTSPEASLTCPGYRVIPPVEKDTVWCEDCRERHPAPDFVFPPGDDDDGDHPPTLEA